MKYLNINKKLLFLFLLTTLTIFPTNKSFSSERNIELVTINDYINEGISLRSKGKIKLSIDINKMPKY